MKLFKKDMANQQNNIEEQINLNIIQNFNSGSKLGEELAEFIRNDEEYAKFNKYME